MAENTEKRIREEENPLGTKPVGGLLIQPDMTVAAERLQDASAVR